MSMFYSSNEGSSTSVVSTAKVILGREREREQGAADLDVLQRVLERRLELERDTPSLLSLSSSSSASSSSSSTSSFGSTSKLSIRDKQQLWGHHSGVDVDDDGKQYAAQPLPRARSSASVLQATDCDNDSGIPERHSPQHPQSDHLDSNVNEVEDGDDTYNYDYHEFYSSRSSSPDHTNQDNESRNNRDSYSDVYSDSQVEVAHLASDDNRSLNASIGADLGEASGDEVKEERRDFGMALDLAYGASAMKSSDDEDEHDCNAVNSIDHLEVGDSSSSATASGSNIVSSTSNDSQNRHRPRPPHGFAYYSAYVSSRRLQGASRFHANANATTSTSGRSVMTIGSTAMGKRDFFMYGGGKDLTTTSSQSRDNSTTRRPAVKRKPVPVDTQMPSLLTKQEKDQIPGSSEENGPKEDEEDGKNQEDEDDNDTNRFSKYSPSVFTFNAAWSPITNDSLFWEAIGINQPLLSPTSTSTSPSSSSPVKDAQFRGDRSVCNDSGPVNALSGGTKTNTHNSRSSSQDHHQINASTSISSSSTTSSSAHHDLSGGTLKSLDGLRGSDKGDHRSQSHSHGRGRSLGIDTSSNLLPVHRHSEEGTSATTAFTNSPSVTAVSSELDPEFSGSAARRMMEFSGGPRAKHTHLRSYSNATTLPSYSPTDTRRRGVACGEESRFSDTDGDEGIGEEEDADEDADARTESTIALDELIEHHSRTPSPEHELESNVEAYNTSYASSSSAPSRSNSPPTTPRRTRTATEASSRDSSSHYSEFELGNDDEGYPISPPPPFSTRPPTQVVMVPKVPLPQILTNVLEDPLGKLSQRSRMSRYVMLSEARGAQQQHSTSAPRSSALSHSTPEVQSSRGSNFNSQKPSAAPFDISCLYACDEQLLLAPMDSFAELCWEDATGGESVRHSGSSDDEEDDGAIYREGYGYGKAYGAVRSQNDKKYEDGQSEVIPSFDDAVSGYGSIVEVRFKHSSEGDIGTIASKPSPRLSDMRHDEKKKLKAELISDFHPPSSSRPSISHIRLPFTGKEPNFIIQNPSYPSSPPPIPLISQHHQHHHRHSPSQDSKKSSVLKSSLDGDFDAIGSPSTSPGRDQHNSKPHAQPHLTLNVRGLKRMASIFTPTKRQAIHEQLALATHS